MAILRLVCSLFVQGAAIAFIELSANSNFTFLTGASHPEEMVSHAAGLGLAAVAIADVNSVAGIVRAHVKARELARDGGPVVRLIPATRLVLRCGFTVTALPKDRDGWGRLHHHRRAAG